MNTESVNMIESGSHRFQTTTRAVKFNETIELEEIENILNNFNKFNRPIEQPTLKQLISDIQNNLWDVECAGGVTFTIGGQVANGQHTLLAHLKCQRTFIGKVEVGAPTKVILFMDTQKKRKPGVGSILCEGLALGVTPTKLDYKTREKKLSVARMCLSCEEKNISPTEAGKQEYYKNHKEGIDFSTTHWENLDDLRPGIRGAIATYFDKCKVKAIEFKRILDAGIDGENVLVDTHPIAVLRKYFDKGSLGGVQQRKDYWTTMYCIHAFHNGKSIKNVGQKKEWEL
jgi:hypothetical protein